MTRVPMQPGEHDIVTDAIAGLVLAATLGLVDLTVDEPGATRTPTPRRRPCFDRDRERE